MGRQNISFREHRDDSQYHPPVGEYSRSGNVGSFVELFNYEIRNCCADDWQLKNRLTTCRKNQNEFIQICGTQIQETILKEIRESTFCCIIADEAKDSFSSIHFCPGTMTTHAESIHSDLQRGLDRRLRHTTLNTEQNQLANKVSADN